MKKYDVIVPLGSTCKTTYNLRKRKLQRESLPGDWIWLRDLEVITNLFRSRFKNFLLKENLVFKPSKSVEHDIFIDKGADVEFWHDFPYQTDLDKDFDEVKVKYNRRIKRLFDDIEKAKRILFFRTVAIEPQEPRDPLSYEKMISDEELVKYHKIWQDLFPGKVVDFIYVNLFYEPREFEKVCLNEHVTKIVAYTPKEDEWIGNQELFDKILNDCILSDRVRFKYFVKSVKSNIYKNFIKAGALLKIPYCVKKKAILKDYFRAD